MDDFGFSTLESLLEAKTAENTKSLVATGGISSAQDIFKSLILGADLASSAGFILKNLMQTGPEKVEEILEQWKQDLNKLFVLTGSKNIAESHNVDLLYSAKMLDFIQQRKK